MKSPSLRLRAGNRQESGSWPRRYAAGLRILDLDQGEPMRGRRNAAASSVAALQHLLRPLRRFFPCADPHEHADDVPYHVLQESVCPDGQDEPFVGPYDGEREDVPVRRESLAASGAERGKIVFAMQAGSGFLHALLVERTVQPPGAIPIERGAHWPVQD